MTNQEVLANMPAEQVARYEKTGALLPFSAWSRATQDHPWVEICHSDGVADAAHKAKAVVGPDAEISVTNRGVRPPKTKPYTSRW
jgi:hypothetical protein